MRVITAPEVDADVEGILDYIAADSPRHAVKYVAGLRKKLKSLGRFPRIHAVRDDLPPEMRAAVYGSHLILYRVGDRTVDVARVVHGAMDLSKIFEK